MSTPKGRPIMNRDDMLSRISTETTPWDLIIIGGGATGVGTAIEAASRGYRVVLAEQHDFSKGTSSRSTKLVHGGVRYLQQGNVALVLEALKERGIMRRNAPHLVHDLPFVVPSYDWWQGPFYGAGLKLYDMLAGRLGFGHSTIISREETIEHIPTIETQGLHGGVRYFDGQFDDSRMVVNMARTAEEQGAVLVNYLRVTGLETAGGMISGVVAVDEESGEEHRIAGRAVINATGVFTDAVRSMDDPVAPPMIRPSQGVHIVLDRSFLPGDSAIMVPHTDDGRVLFAIPWHNRVIVGTTDTPVDDAVLEPCPLPEELDFLLQHAARYLTTDPGPDDIKSMFAGLRPLVSANTESNTASISRDHTLNISRTGLVTITGGKWTTYRRMAEDTVNHAAVIAQLEERASVTSDLPIHGFHNHADRFGDLACYGSDAPTIQSLFADDPAYAERLHPDLPIRAGEVVWAVRNEMARTVEDVLARRTRALLLDARASIVAAPAVSRIMAAELDRSPQWAQTTTAAFVELAGRYLPG
jgi:glycerol-3-phosphate dehydrogenase